MNIFTKLYQPYTCFLKIIFALFGQASYCLNCNYSFGSSLFSCVDEASAIEALQTLADLSLRMASVENEDGKQMEIIF